MLKLNVNDDTKSHVSLRSKRTTIRELLILIICKLKKRKKHFDESRLVYLNIKQIISN